MTIRLFPADRYDRAFKRDILHFCYSVSIGDSIVARFKTHSQRYDISTLNEALLAGVSFAVLPYTRIE